MIKKEKKIGIIISKPLDIFNANILCNNFFLEKDNILIFIMKGQNNNNLIEASKKYFPNADYLFFNSPDLYSLFYSKLNNFLLNFWYKNKLVDIVHLTLKIIIFICSRFYWYPSYLYNKIKYRKLKFDFLVTDPWASKLFFTFCLKYSNLILQDGGYSTETFKLLDEAILNKHYRPINLISKSLKQQKQKLPLPIRISFKYFLKKKISFFVTNQYYLSKSLKRLNLDGKTKLKNDWIKIFRINNVFDKSIKVDEDELYIILANSISIEDYLKKIKMLIGESKFKKIYVRPHPKSNFSNKLKNKLCAGLRKFTKNIKYIEPINSFEQDLLEMKSIPSVFLRHDGCTTNAFLERIDSKKIKLMDF